MEKLDLANYKLLKKRVYAPVHVYKGKDTFLRVGPQQAIKNEIQLHRGIFKLGFPVPQIIRTGKIDGKSFFEEESFGQKHFGNIFAEDMKAHKKISDKNFSLFLKVVLTFAETQIKHPSRRRDNSSFFKGTHFHNIIKERSELKYKTDLAWKKILKQTQELPFVLTHGDLGPFNIYPKGVIDLESFFRAPVGYDLVTAIYMTDFFPKGSGYEMRQLFKFSQKQKKLFLAAMDKLFLKHKLPQLSLFLDEFILTRCIWVATRMQDWPKIQNWRYQQYNRLLSAYLSGQPLEKYL